MNKRTPVSVYRLFSILSNKQILFDSFQRTLEHPVYGDLNEDVDVQSLSVEIFESWENVFSILQHFFPFSSC